jgi:hypothetical protein
MMRRFALLSTLLLAALPVQAASGQEEGTTVTLTVSPTLIRFDGFGGSFGAAVARLSVSRGFSQKTGGELSAFTLAPLGGATSIPDCVAEAYCRTLSTPSALTGALASVFGYAGDLRASVGAGGVAASGGEGFANRSSLAGLIGLDYIPRTNNRFAPTFALRIVQLSRPIAGARQLLLPGVGLTF